MSTKAVEPDPLKVARRSWYRAGVRRQDRDRLASELVAETGAAAEAGVSWAVLGEDPATAARAWAVERGLAGRRLRLPLILPTTMVAAVLAGGATLALLFQDFRNGGGNTFLDQLNGAGVLIVYLVSGVLAYAAMLAVTGSVLTAVGDQHVRSTVQALAALLPIGCVASVTAGVSTAWALHFATRPRTFTIVIVIVVLVLAATITAGRAVAVRRALTAPAPGDR